MQARYIFPLYRVVHTVSRVSAFLDHPVCLLGCYTNALKQLNM